MQSIKVFKIFILFDSKVSKVSDFKQPVFILSSNSTKNAISNNNWIINI